MTINDSWVYQGRKEHGYFGDGTSPKDDTSKDPAGATNQLFAPANAAQRVDYAAHSIIMRVPQGDRSRWNSAVTDSARDNLKTAVAGWYGGKGLGRDAFRARFLDPSTGDQTVDLLRSAARGMVEGRNYDDLSQAGKDLATAAQQVGVYRWPRFLGDASPRAVEAVSNGTVPGVTKVAADTATDLVRLIVLGLLAIMYAIRQSYPSAQPNRHSAPPSPPLPIITQAVPVPPPKEGETPADVLKPDGQYVGKPGENSGVRELPGGEEEARELFDRLTKGGTDIARPGRAGKVIEVPGGIIGYHPQSKSGPPTIDVNMEGMGLRKLKFPGGPTQ